MHILIAVCCLAKIGGLAVQPLFSCFLSNTQQAILIPFGTRFLQETVEKVLKLTNHCHRNRQGKYTVFLCKYYETQLRFQKILKFGSLKI